MALPDPLQLFIITSPAAVDHHHYLYSPLFSHPCQIFVWCVPVWFLFLIVSCSVECFRAKSVFFVHRGFFAPSVFTHRVDHPVPASPLLAFAVD
jgi:hypothetical protein